MYDERSPALSPTAVSNLYTMGCTAVVDPRQCLPAVYSIPSPECRVLRARLILEEALEACDALGISVDIKPDGSNGPTYRLDHLEGMKFELTHEPNLDQIIDACCDEIYVSVGTLCACGVSDMPHMNAVNNANDAKFPGGKAIANEHGKFQKPEGWKPPDHMKVLDRLAHVPNLNELSRGIVQSRAAVSAVPIEHQEHGNKQS